MQVHHFFAYSRDSEHSQIAAAVQAYGTLVLHQLMQFLQIRVGNADVGQLHEGIANSQLQTDGASMQL